MNGRGWAAGVVVVVVLKRLQNPLAVVLWQRAQNSVAGLGANYHHYSGLDCGLFI